MALFGDSQDWRASRAMGSWQKRLQGDFFKFLTEGPGNSWWERSRFETPDLFPTEAVYLRRP